MIRQLAEIRLSRLSLTALAALSLLATALIISGGDARTPAQIAAAAALHGHPVRVVTAPGPAPAGGAASSSAGPSSATAAPVPVSPSAGTGSAGGVGAGTTGADGGGSPSDAGAPATPSHASSDGGSNTAAPSTPTGTSTTKPSVPADLPKVGHVFEIALSTTSYAAAFGPDSDAPYLRTLEQKGTLLNGYHSLGSGELADDLALVSGQGPDPDTAAGCTTYAEFPTGTTAKSDGLITGNGCVYPETALTIGDQVSASGHVWKAYVADMGKQTCVHPDSNAVAGGELPDTEPGYDPGHNPFIYFHSLLDLGDCSSNDQDLSRLGPALKKASGAPTFSFISPGECEDAGAAPSGASAPPTTSTTTTTTSASSSTTTAAATTTAPSTTTSSSTSPSTTPIPATTGTSTPTGTSSTPSSPAGTPGACPAGQPVGIAAEDAFLRLWVPRILASSAYRSAGMLVIAFAAAGAKSGGDPVRTGALVLSRFARRGKTVTQSYGPYSALRSIEQLLGYEPLAYAKSAPSFAHAVLHKRS